MEQKKRIRPTLGQVRALEAEISRLNEIIESKGLKAGDAWEKKYHELERISKRNDIIHENLVEESAKMSGEILDLRNEVDQLKKELIRKSDSTIPVADYKKLKDEYNTINRSNGLMEKELEKARKTITDLSNDYDDYRRRMEELRSRGFWARVFNK